MSDLDAMIARRCSRNARRPLASVVALLWLVAPAGATTLNVDLGDGPVYAGTADAPDPGTVWNAHTSAGGTTALLDSSGAATAVAFTLGATSALASPTPVNDLVADGLHEASGAAFMISGLLPSAEYDLYAYASVGATAGHAASFWAFSTPVLSGPIATGGALSSDVFRLESTAGGVIEGTFCPGFCSVIGLPATGFQLTPVPEPEPALLLGLVLATGGGALRRWGRAGAPGDGSSARRG